MNQEKLLDYSKQSKAFQQGKETRTGIQIEDFKSFVVKVTTKIRVHSHDFNLVLGLLTEAIFLCKYNPLQCGDIILRIFNSTRENKNLRLAACFMLHRWGDHVDKKIEWDQFASDTIYSDKFSQELFNVTEQMQIDPKEMGIFIKLLRTKSITFDLDTEEIDQNLNGSPLVVGNVKLELLEKGRIEGQLTERKLWEVLEKKWSKDKQELTKELLDTMEGQGKEKQKFTEQIEKLTQKLVDAKKKGK